MGSSYIGPYVVNDKLGKGLFGKSRHCSTIDNFPIAIKIIEALPGINKAKLMNDVSVFYNKLNKAGNPKERYPLLRFREVMEIDDRCFAIISDYYPQGNLGQNMLIKKEMHATLLEMRQIAQGVEWIHRLKITHGDLKPNNILLQEGQLIIADVLPPAFRGCLRLRETQGTYDYFAPEMLSGTLMPPAADIWSLGVIFLEMFHGRHIRELCQQRLGLRPSVNDNYPPGSVIAAVTHPNLQSLLYQMLRPTPIERVDIREVINKLEEMTDMHLQTMRRVILREQAIDQKDNNMQALPILLTFDGTTPYSRHFSFTGNKVIRLDQEKIRIQAVSREKIPLGVWSISIMVNNYGTWNDEVAIGFTTEQRRYERMSGDIDQAGCIAYWSSFANKKSNLCSNGEWYEQPLPFLQAGKNVLQMVVNVEERSIYWYVDSQWIKETPMPRYFWDQSLFFFVGLMGKNCSVELLQTKTYQYQ